ncbi:MAG: DUF1570 domain-containing protein [Pirellulales bacterium]|nr:DUF1570 domain-containing protein [Pirellulales bacterium]
MIDFQKTQLAASLLLCCVSVVDAGGPAKFMMATSVDGRLLEGQPLAWTDQTMFLLGRDGALHEFAPQAARNSRKTSPTFRSYTVTEMRSRLQTEFDNAFDVSSTTHFVVVHPQGEWSAWAERLESLYRSFTHYMQVRGFGLQQPRVPLVAIVFRNQADYYRYATANGSQLQPGTLGHYDPVSNRIFLFDANHNRGDADWSANSKTIIHEATHQTAYNVGVHRRFAEQPRWLVEGLAMMFEARGVWDSRSTFTRTDRINHDQLHNFQSDLESRPNDVIAHLVSSDRFFRSSPRRAYAEAWTLSFFLCETRPQDYSRYLARVAARKPFSKYSAQERLADFTASFGNDLEMLNVQLLRFIEEL